MLSAYSLRDVLLSVGSNPVVKSGEFDAQVESVRLFAGANHVQPSCQEQVIEIYDAMRPSLLAYLGSLGLARNDSEDIIHDSFLRLFDHMAGKAKSENLRGWIFRVAHNLAMDGFRVGRRIPKVDDGMEVLSNMFDSSFSPEENTLKSEEIHRVQTALRGLTSQQRAAVLLRAEELRYREIAAVLGVSTKRVYELVQRALARLAGDV